MRRVLGAAAAFILATTPSVALACPVCFSATEQNRDAFLITTIILSLLPLAAVGGFVVWLWQRHRELDAEATPPVADNASLDVRS